MNETSWGNGKGPRAALAEAIRRAELMMQQGSAGARRAPTPPTSEDWYGDQLDAREQLGGVTGSAPVNLTKSLASDSKFIFPVHTEQKEWGTLRSPGLDSQASVDSGPRRPSSGRRAASSALQGPGRDHASSRAYAESRLVYPDSSERGEWSSLPRNDNAPPVHEPVVASRSAEGAVELGGLGEDSVDLLLARNEERLRRLEGISA